MKYLIIGVCCLAIGFVAGTAVTCYRVDHLVTDAIAAAKGFEARYEYSQQQTERALVAGERWKSRCLECEREN